MNKELKKEAREEIVIMDGKRVDAGTTEWVHRKVNKYIDKATLAERERCLKEIDEARNFTEDMISKGKADRFGMASETLRQLRVHITNDDSIRPTTIPGGRKVKTINTKDHE